MKRIIALLLSLILLCACTPAPAQTGPLAETGGPTPDCEKPAGEAAPVAGESATPVNAVTYPSAADFSDFDAQLKNREDNAVTEEFLSALEAFAFKAGAAVLNRPGENTNFSPLSLYLALALAAPGAAGETQAELLTLLGAEDAEALADQCARLYRLLYTDNGVGKLFIANSLWMDDEVRGSAVQFREGYLNTAARDFYAELFTVDFAGEAASQAMVRWVADHTGGILSPVFPTDPEQVLSILNTVYFYDEWINAFPASATQSGVFHADKGDVNADYMNRSDQGSFARGNGFIRASLGLKTQGQMVFVLPDEGVALSDLTGSGQTLRELVTGGTESYGEITWSVPKFRYGCTYDLAGTLASLGLSAAFDSTKADFSPMTDTPVWLSKVNQQTHIAIDEKGVEAAAFTEMGFAGAAMPQDHAEMILNRPFAYGILSRDGALLFMGVCADPSAVS